MSLVRGEEYRVFIPECHEEAFTIKLVDAKLGSQKAVVQIFMGDKLVVEDVIGYNVDIEEPEKMLDLYNVKICSWSLKKFLGRGEEEDWSPARCLHLAASS